VYAAWQNSDAFKTGQNQDKPAYCIMLPPPNVTGSLHMGHAFQQTLIDILIRYQRMQGHPTLWQVGTDHAGIATQMVVENQLHQQGKTRYDLGRDTFVKKVWEWKDASGDAILKQMQRLGVSPEWSRSRFTMDEGLSKAVRTAFVKLHAEGLIYRGKRLVNWDPHFKTAVSDLEVVHSEEQGFMYHIAYPYAGGKLVIATTRPETLLGDAAVAIHPEDSRYQHLLGQMIDLPLCQRQVPIIADDYVDQAFGTGCVKITPAHDFNDYEVGKRHDLPMLNIFNPDGTLNDTVPQAYRGLDRFAARKQILKDLDALGLLIEKKPHTLNIPRNDRGNHILEPMLTNQWYVKMDAMAKDALKVVQTGEVKFVPEDWQNTYFRWLENIQDWCVSRQLWWGHRIPAWYDEAGNIYVGENEAAVRAQHHLADALTLRQEEDVLDTWFSAALWPFSTLGWPEKTPDLARFYPTSVLVTGFDIIFFWVARMMMFGLYFTKQVPFKTIYIHGLIRDSEGQKMSKTKGNVLDPVDLIDGISLHDLVQKRTASMMQESLKERAIKATEKQFPQGIQAYGTDALRLTFASIASLSRDINFDIKRLEGYRNFCNKLWNATRFVLMNIGEHELLTPMMDQGEVMQGIRGGLSTTENIHQYFESRLSQVIASVQEAVEAYRFDLMAQTLYEFFWNDYCDWYLEFCKIILNDAAFTEMEKAHARYSLLAMLEKILRLLHPIIPFITEEIWQTIKQPLGIQAEYLIHQPYPSLMHIEASSWNFTPWLMELVTQIRTIRSERAVHPGKVLPLYFEGQLDFAPESFMVYLSAFAKIDRCATMQTEYAATSQRLSIYQNLYLGDVVDLAQEHQRIQKELLKLDEEIARISHKLSNAAFVDKAPAAVVEKEQQRLQECQQRKALLEKDQAILEL
jgi:valyl-tRNA synthetase